MRVSLGSKNGNEPRCIQTDGDPHINGRVDQVEIKVSKENST